MDYIINKLLIIPGIIIGFSLHEYAHARVAVALGDDTPKYQGRVTLDPLAHMDVIGFILLLIAGFGWAKPVQINERNFKNPRRDDILVSLAGPLMNFIVAIIFLLIIKTIYMFQISFMNERILGILIQMLFYGVWINVVLMVFNLLPIPPLDGYHILGGILDLRSKGIYYQLYNKGMLILLILIITDIIGKIISPPIFFIYNFITALIL